MATRRFSTLLVLLLVAGCGILGLDDGTTLQLAVAPYKGSCFGLHAMLCLQVREVGDTEFLNMYDAPEGFEYEWGFDYVILVREKTVDDPPADGSSVVRRLLDVVSKTPVASGASFELAMYPSGLQPSGSDRYSLYSGSEEVTCAAGQGCSELAAAVAGGSGIHLVLMYPDSPGTVFPLVSWSECPTGDGPCDP